MEASPQKVLVVGSGGREHALVLACKHSPLVEAVHAAPGNGGMAMDATCHAIGVDDKAALVELAKAEAIDLVIVGPEAPLCAGLVDELEAAGIAAYGPNKAAAELEASKDFTKNFLERHAIPTAASKSFTELAPALEYLTAREQLSEAVYPVVIKASGLAAGKGVIIAQDRAEAEEALSSMLEDGQFGDAGATVLVEDYLDGEEASIHVMISGEKFLMLPASQDHKRIGEGDTGPNTGGMGAYAPAAVVTPELFEQIRTCVVEPTVKGLASEGIDFHGTLFVGIMIVKGVAKVLEFNVRFGDPETQVLLPLLETDPIAIMHQIATRKFEPAEVKVKPDYAMVVVLAAGGYPGSYEKGKKITLPRAVTKDASIIHAGTKLAEDGETLLTAGGRVLGVVGQGETLSKAATVAYHMTKQVCWEGVTYRRDIGHRQLAREG